MKTKLTQYRESIAKMRYYLAQLSGGGAGGEADWAQKAAKEIRQTQYAFNPDVQMVEPLAAIILRNSQQARDCQLKYTALLTYELNRLPYQPPRPKRGLIARCFRLLKP